MSLQTDSFGYRDNTLVAMNLSLFQSLSSFTDMLTYVYWSQSACLIDTLARVSIVVTSSNVESQNLTYLAFDVLNLENVTG